MQSNRRKIVSLRNLWLNKADVVSLAKFYNFLKLYLLKPLLKKLIKKNANNKIFLNFEGSLEKELYGKLEEEPEEFL